MTDKIRKFLKKISKKERKAISSIVSKIISRDFSGLDIKKMKGHKNLYRVRKGNIRIVFVDNNSDDPYVIFIGRRGDSDYEKF